MGGTLDQRAQHGVAPERLVDRGRVGVEVEQAPDATDRRREIAPVGETERRRHMIDARRQSHGAVAVRQTGYFPPAPLITSRAVALGAIWRGVFPWGF